MVLIGRYGIHPLDLTYSKRSPYSLNFLIDCSMHWSLRGAHTLQHNQWSVDVKFFFMPLLTFFGQPGYR